MCTINSGLAYFYIKKMKPLLMSQYIDRKKYCVIVSKHNTQISNIGKSLYKSGMSVEEMFAFIFAFALLYKYTIGIHCFNRSDLKHYHLH